VADPVDGGALAGEMFRRCCVQEIATATRQNAWVLVDQARPDAIVTLLRGIVEVECIIVGLDSLVVPGSVLPHCKVPGSVLPHCKEVHYGK
jgi:hypothetical protein